MTVMESRFEVITVEPVDSDPVVLSKAVQFPDTWPAQMKFQELLKSTTVSAGFQNYAVEHLDQPLEGCTYRWSRAFIEQAGLSVDIGAWVVTHLRRSGALTVEVFPDATFREKFREVVL